MGATAATGQTHRASATRRARAHAALCTHACASELSATPAAAFWPRAAVRFAKGRGPSLAVKGTRRRWPKRAANGEYDVCAGIRGNILTKVEVEILKICSHAVSPSCVLNFFLFSVAISEPQTPRYRRRSFIQRRLARQ